MALLGVALVAAGTMLLTAAHRRRPLRSRRCSRSPRRSHHRADHGLTPTLPAGGQLVLTVLMFVGRVGHDRRRVGDRPEHPTPALPLPGGATHCWLTEITARRTDSVVVIGLGRFGCQVAASLTRLGHEVLGHRPQTRRSVQRWSAQLDQVVQADATEDGALRQLGVTEFRRAVVGHRGVGGGQRAHRAGAGRAGCAADLGAGHLAEARQDPVVGRRAPRDLSGGGDRASGSRT